MQNKLILLFLILLIGCVPDNHTHTKSRTTEKGEVIGIFREESFFDHRAIVVDVEGNRERFVNKIYFPGDSVYVHKISYTCGHFWDYYELGKLINKDDEEK